MATPSSPGMVTPRSSGATSSSSSGASTSCSASCSSQSNQGTATSRAPAGQTYRGVEHAGECTLEMNAGAYPDTKKSYMIPPMFINEYPEPVDETTGEVRKHTRSLTKKEDNRFIGMRANASAEQAEYDVFSVFERLVARETKEALLVLRNFQLNPNDDQDFRTKVLTQEIGADFTGLDTNGECDAVIAVRNLGLVLVEIKTKFNEKQQTKAENQLERGQLLFQRIMSHIAGSACQMPVVKLAIFAQEESPSPSKTSSSDCRIIHKDQLTTQNYIQTWNKLMVELSALKADNPFSDNDFRRFVRTISGVWCMQTYQKQYRYNNDEASSSYMLQQNDDMVNRQIFTSDVSKAKDKSQIPPPVVDVELCRPSEGFPECKGLEVIYLTPGQKEFYQKFGRAILRGPAGSGKTILFYLKMVDILQNHPNKNMLIIAPPNHTLRFEQFLRSNGAHPIMFKTFPPPMSGGVIIMELNDFFRWVSTDTLNSYEVTNHHIFMDDFQQLRFQSISSVTYDDVVAFIERTHATLSAQLTLWCAVDVGQSFSLNANNNDNVSKLFFRNSSTARSLNIPVYVLHSVLRNSVEISTAVKKVRDSRNAKQKFSSIVLSNFDTGHRIRSQSVIYHKLMDWAGSKGYGFGDRESGKFVAERVREELKSLIDVGKPDVNLNDIAVLYGGTVHDVADRPIRYMLFDTFNIIAQKIEQSITTNNNTIILDSYHNVASFECACVVYVRGASSAIDCKHYSAMSRARTKLVVVDIDREQRRPLLTDDDVIMTTWEEKNGSFHKL